MKLSEQHVFQVEDYTFFLEYNPSLNKVKPVWEKIESECHGEIFTTWLWIGCWLKEVIQDMDYCFLSAKYNNRIVACAVLIPNQNRRYRIIQSQQWFINEFPQQRNMAIEYNSILAIEEHKERLAHMFALLFNRLDNWDELIVSAVSAHALYPKWYDASICRIFEKKSITRGINLIAFSNNDERDIRKTLLSKNKRAQINRSIKRYEHEYGERQLFLAQDVKQALHFFFEMGKLHTDYWNSKGKAGSFSNHYWLEFHKSIIKTGFSQGKICIYRVSFGNEVIGYLYNLVSNNKIYNIQSGFSYSSDNRDKPGWVCHILAIEDCYKQGYGYYDLLAGDEAYKKSLANSEQELYWYVYQKQRCQFKIERGLKKLKRLLLN